MGGRSIGARRNEPVAPSRDACYTCGMATEAEEIDPALLHRLLEAEAPLTPEAIGGELGLAAATARARLETLRQAGCELDWHPQRGVRLLSAGLGCWADYIEARHAGRLGRRVTLYRETASTQEAARRLLSGADPARHGGHVILADHQTSGRGRMGRSWLAAPGEGLLLSVIHCPVDETPGATDRLVIGSCYAVAEAVEHAVGLSIQIRWPNDLLVDGAKLAGILVERRDGAAVIGIGLNVGGAPQRLPAAGGGANGGAGATDTATSLAEHGGLVDRLRLLDLVLDRLDATLRWADDRALHRAWKARSCLLGRRVTVDAEGRPLTGRVVELDPKHGLMLQVDGGAVVTLPAETTSLVSG